MVSGFEPIRNPKRAKQLISFEGMNLGGRRWPTDFDAVIDWKGKAWLVYEVKHGDAFMPDGQRIALGRFVDDMAASRKPAIAIVSEHHVDDPEINVELSDCDVREYYIGKRDKWKLPEKPMKVGELTYEFIAQIERKSA